MPEEHEIEKSLRAYAKRRREQGGTPPELHPATRKLLQGQVAELRRETRTTGFGLRWFWASPVRLGSVVTVAAALAIVVAIIVSRQGRGPSQLANAQLAKNSPPPAIEMDRGNVSLAQSQTTRAQGGTDKPLPQAGSLNQPSVAPAAAQPAGMSVGERAATVSGVGATAPVREAPMIAANKSAAPALAAQPASPRAAPMSDSFFLRTAASNVTPQVTRHFDRLNLAAANSTQDSATGGNLLSSFRLEQNGDQLRVIDDNDGSVYTGTLTNSPPAALVGATAAPDGSLPMDLSRGAVASDALQQTSNAADTTSETVSGIATNAAPVPNYAFAVSGTNLTLNQLVVMTGTVGPNFAQFGRGRRVGGAGGGGGGFGGGGGGTGGLPAGGVPGGARGGRGRPAAAFQLRGAVTIGTNQFSINATPSSQ